MAQHTLSLLLLVGFSSGGYLYNTGYSPAYYPNYLSYSGYPTYYGVRHASPSFTVLAEQPYTVDKSLTTVPLIAVPRQSLNVLRTGHISAISPTRPVVTLQAPTIPSGEQEATPAVRIVLKRPMLISAPQSTIAFPTSFTVVHDGLRMPIPVGAVLAPVPSGAYLTSTRPVAVGVIYAVPTGPLPFQYPFYQTVPIRRPVHGPTTAVIRPVSPTVPTSTVTPLKPSLPSRPQQQYPEYSIISSRPSIEGDNSLLVQGPRPSAPVVTILDFPSSVASPSVLFFQQPALDEDTELGNREPPQAAVPAGIVQSTAPVPNLSVFVNSKESPVLQALREESEKRVQQQSNLNKMQNSL